MLTKYHAIIFISILTMLVLLGLHLLGIASNVINHQNSTASGPQVALARGGQASQNTNNQFASATTNRNLPLTAPNNNNNNNNNDYTHPISFDRISSNNKATKSGGFDSDSLSSQSNRQQQDNSNDSNQMAPTNGMKRTNQPEYPIDHYQISQSTNQPLDNQIPPTPTQQNRFNNNNNPVNFNNPFGPPAPPMPMPPNPPPLQSNPPVSSQASPQSQSTQQSTQSPQASMTAPITATNQPKQQFNNQQQTPPLASDNRFQLRPSSGATSHTAAPGQAAMRLSGNQIESENYTPPIMYGNHQYLNNINNNNNNNNQEPAYSNNQQQQFTDDQNANDYINGNSINVLRDPRRDPTGVTKTNNNINNNNNNNYNNQQASNQGRTNNNNNDNRQQAGVPFRHLTSPLPSSYFEQQHQPNQLRHKQLPESNRLTNFVPTEKRILPPPLPAHYKDVNTLRKLPPPMNPSSNNNFESLNSNRSLSPRFHSGNMNMNYNTNNNNNRPNEPDIGLTALPPYSLPVPPSLEQQRSNHKLEQQQLQQLSALNNIPLCARALGATDNEMSANNQVIMCQEDSDYPTKAVMAALELYGPQILEQIMPQSIISNNHLSRLNQQRNLQLDSLRPPPISANIGSNTNHLTDVNYDNLCKSKITLVQPRRAKNFQGQWKVVVNFPNADRFRGISLSQPVRIEECNQLNIECGGADKNLTSPIPKTRCLQQYGDHRLVAWSSQRGLHVDMFRLPVSCSCHLRR